MLPHHAALGVVAVLAEDEDVLQRDGVSLHALHFRDLHHPPLAVTQARTQVERERDDLAAQVKLKAAESAACWQG